MSHIRLDGNFKSAVPLGDQPGAIFRQARYFRWGRYNRDGTRVRPPCPIWIVLHTAECAETKSAAEGLQAYAATMDDGRVASWHFGVDSDSVTQSVLEKDTAFHAPPLNPYSVGIECAGRAAQVAGDWSDSYSEAMIELQLAPLLASVCKRRLILPREISDDLLRVGLGYIQGPVRYSDGLAKYSGIVTHAQVSRVFRKSRHTDPGGAFPMEKVIEATLSHPAGGGVTPSGGAGA